MVAENCDNNNSGVKATGAALVSPDFRRQILLMFERDGVSAEEISDILGVPVLIVQSIVQPAQNKSSATPAPNSGNEDDEYSEQLSTVRSIESRLGDAEQAAIDTLDELVRDSESEGVRLGSAKLILEVRAGKLRPEKPVKHNSSALTPEAFQDIVRQAILVHEEAKQRLADSSAIPV